MDKDKEMGKLEFTKAEELEKWNYMIKPGISPEN